MRHSKIDLTMNTYVDPKLLDVAGAVEALPALPLEDGRQNATIALSATGTDDLPACSLVPNLVPTTGKLCTLGSILDKLTTNGDSHGKADDIDASGCVVKENNPLTTAVSGLRLVGGTGLEPVTPSLSSWCSNQLS